METRELTCIGCPMGCQLSAVLDGGEIRVTGNQCARPPASKKRLTKYRKKWKIAAAPERIVTSAVPVKGGAVPMVSVKTRESIPKAKIFACMEEIRRVSVVAPVKIGDIIIENCAGTGVPVVATKDVGKAEQ